MFRGFAAGSGSFVLDLVRRASRIPLGLLGGSAYAGRSGIVSVMAEIDEPVRRPGDDAHIEPARRNVKLARRGSFVVAVRRGRTPPLTRTEVAAVIDEIRGRDDRDDLGTGVAAQHTVLTYKTAREIQ